MAIEDHVCQHQERPEEHVFVKTVVTTYRTRLGKEVECVKELDYPLPDRYLGPGEVASWVGSHQGLNGFSIRTHYDDGCVRDFVPDALDAERRRARQ